MEIIIGVVLLIGAFALGQTTADREAAESQASLEREQRVASSEQGFLPRGCRYRVSGPLQRDLTLTYNRQQRNEQAGSTATKVAFGND